MPQIAWIVVYDEGVDQENVAVRMTDCLIFLASFGGSWGVQWLTWLDPV